MTTISPERRRMGTGSIERVSPPMRNMAEFPRLKNIIRSCKGKGLGDVRYRDQWGRSTNFGSINVAAERVLVTIELIRVFKPLQVLPSVDRNLLSQHPVLRPTAIYTINTCKEWRNNTYHRSLATSPSLDLLPPNLRRSYPPKLDASRLTLQHPYKGFSVPADIRPWV